MRKNLLRICLTIPLILCVFSVETNVASTVEYPAIMVVPESTWDETLSPSKNYTISIYTNYTEDYIWGYEFTLTYNSSVLHGGVNLTDTWIANGTQKKFYTTYTPVVNRTERVYVNTILQTRDVDYRMNYPIGEVYFKFAPPADAEVKATYLWGGVVNGNLITKEKDPSAEFQVGTFDNEAGKLELTGAYFYYPPYPPNTTCGPGILANVTFTVVGYGFSDITIGDDTKLWGFTEAKGFYTIIYAKSEPDHIRHGFFSNKILGDVNGDGAVDTIDLIAFGEAYGSVFSKPNWNPHCDFTCDDKVDGSDLFDLSKNYGKSI